MILWTPMQLELVLEGLEKMSFSDCKKVSYQGVPMLVERTADGGTRIVRLLSTDPVDYLDFAHSPGRHIDA